MFEYDALGSDVSPDLVESRLITVANAFGGLEQLQGKRILDLGCGSRNSADNRMPGGGMSRVNEPWLCRALHKLGAQAVGVDICDSGGEKFEFHVLDLRRHGAWQALPDRSFDGICSWGLLNSPTLTKYTSLTDRGAMIAEMMDQIKRLLSPAGKLICVSPGLDEAQDILMADWARYLKS